MCPQSTDWILGPFLTFFIFTVLRYRAHFSHCFNPLYCHCTEVKRMMCELCEHESVLHTWNGHRLTLLWTVAASFSSPCWTQRGTVWLIRNEICKSCAAVASTTPWQPVSKEIHSCWVKPQPGVLLLHALLRLVEKQSYKWCCEITETMSENKNSREGKVWMIGYLFWGKYGSFFKKPWENIIARLLPSVYSSCKHRH